MTVAYPFVTQITCPISLFIFWNVNAGVHFAVLAKVYSIFSFSEITSDYIILNFFCRYLLVDSFDITAYGFIDVNYDVKSSLMTHENGSMYFLVPQVTLDSIFSNIIFCIPIIDIKPMTSTGIDNQVVFHIFMGSAIRELLLT